MKYRRIFKKELKSKEESASTFHMLADRRDGLGYAYSDKIELHVNVALATGRPLLIRGEPGSGKSSLAASVAYKMGWNYLEVVVTSRTQARDLLWRFDSLRRLSDAEAGRISKDHDSVGSSPVSEREKYVEPGVLWWAFDPISARRRGSKKKNIIFPIAEPTGKWRDARRSVVLIDEIDKADPEVPNDLLVPIGSLEFEVEEIGRKIQCINRNAPPLVMITSNGERELPPAFLRRCVTLTLERPDARRFLEIAQKYFANDLATMNNAHDILPLMEIVPSGVDQNRPKPSTAEFLDAIQACRQLHVQPISGTVIWEYILRTTLWK